ncbi:MAG: hypothetical protein ACE3JP_10675 [Ectobacillus sp.]
MLYTYENEARYHGTKQHMFFRVSYLAFWAAMGAEAAIEIKAMLYFSIA